MRRFLLFAVIFISTSTACSHKVQPADSTASVEGSATGRVATKRYTGQSDIATETTKPSATPTITSTPTATRIAVGPGYMTGVNPLTGLGVQDESSLKIGPVLVSITNFPISARPQSALSLADHVWETSIGEGMTRFIAIFYGDYLEKLRLIESDLDPTYDREFIVGPVRSGRVAFQEIKRLYPGGRLLIRYASQEVIKQLTGWILVRAVDPNDVNSAGLTLEDLESLDLPEIDPNSYAHLTFDSRVPTGGIEDSQLSIIYNYLNNVGWTYDPESRTYLRFQDQADGSGELFPITDRLTGEHIAFDNVLVLWARHSFENVQGTILEINLVYLPDGYGLLYRDGMRYEIRWSTRSGELRVHDKEGNPIPLKPGRTFFEVVSQFSTWDQEQGVVRFVRPALPTLTPTPTLTVTPIPTPTLTPTVTP